MIVAIGYRVNQPGGTQFRKWATTHLKQNLIKGFVMDDERLKGVSAEVSLTRWLNASVLTHSTWHSRPGRAEESARAM
nr:RhuM family protein [Herbaspirillum sp. WGmk3]